MEEREKIGDPPVGIEPARSAQFVGHGDQVSRLVSLGEVDQGAVDLSMSIPIKVIRGKDLHHPVDRLILNKDAAQDGLFRLDVLGRDFMGREFRSFHVHPVRKLRYLQRRRK